MDTVRANKIDRETTRNIDMRGRRIVNASDSQNQQDYTTAGEVGKLIASVLKTFDSFINSLGKFLYGNLTVGYIPKIIAGNKLGDSPINDDGTTILTTARNLANNGTRAHIRSTVTSGTQPSRVGQIVDGNSTFLTLNISYDGANWNLDDTSKTGTLIRLSLGKVDIFTVAAGPNPVAPVLNCTIDAAGNINVLGIYKVNGANGVNGALVLNLTTQVIQYKDWASVNQSITVVTNVTLTANNFTGGLRTT